MIKFIIGLNLLCGNQDKIILEIKIIFKILNNKLIKIDEAYTKGINPCHLAINERNDFLVAVNYTSGDFSSYKVSSDGKLTFIEQITHNGSSVNINRQREPHAHSINFLDNNSFYVFYV